MSTVELFPVVIDNGSSAIKAGFAGDDEPTTIVASFVGQHRKEIILPQQQVYVGRSVGGMKVTYPIKEGIITDWDVMQEIWQHVFNQLNVTPPEHHVLLTDIPLKFSTNRMQMAQVMFEYFSIPKLIIGTRPVLSLFSTGRTSGSVLQSGDSVSYAVPIREGVCLDSTERSNLAGRNVTDYLVKSVYERGFSLTGTSGRKAAQDIKEKLALIAIEEKNENQSYFERTFELPDGELLTIGNERFECTEILFNMCEGLHKMAYSSITRCGVDFRKEEIILAGGNTMLHGFEYRLQKELNILGLSNTELKVIAPPERRYSAWIGGSILASMEQANTVWIYKDQYEEIGYSIIHRLNLL